MGDSAAASEEAIADGAPVPPAGSRAPLPGRARRPLKSKHDPGVVRYVNGKLVEDSSPPVIQIISEFNNQDHGKVDVPAYPGDMVYMGINVQTEGGTPVRGATVQVESPKGNAIVMMGDHTDKEGYLEFRMMASKPGKDRVKVSAAGVDNDFFLDVTDPPRSEWLGGLNLKGVTSWDLLMSANVKIGRDTIDATFPFALETLREKTVRLVGFMLPLGINEKQDHFLFSANPPSCYFHPPGGPTSAVEVFVNGNIEMDQDPMVIEGTLELVPHGEGGMVYKLRDAKLIAKAS